MPYYHICPQCGAHLDPGERCDCEDGKEKRPPPLQRETAGKESYHRYYTAPRRECQRKG